MVPEPHARRWRSGGPAAEVSAERCFTGGPLSSLDGCCIYMPEKRVGTGLMQHVTAAEAAASVARALSAAAPDCQHLPAVAVAWAPARAAAAAPTGRAAGVCAPAIRKTRRSVWHDQGRSRRWGRHRSRQEQHLPGRLVKNSHNVLYDGLVHVLCNSRKGGCHHKGHGGRRIWSGSRSRRQIEQARAPPARSTGRDLQPHKVDR